MAKGKNHIARSTKMAASKPEAKSRTLRVARHGVKTSRDFASFMSGLMSDLIEGKVPPQVGYAACHAGGKLLRIVEMQFKYGNPLATSFRGTTTPKSCELPLAEDAPLG